MKHVYTGIKKSFLTFVLLVITTSVFAQEPFNCQTEAYLFQKNDVFAQNLASGSASLDGIDLDPANINGVGYNNKDGYIWGSLKSPSNTIIRVGNNYEVTTYTIANAPFSYVGDVDPNGIYHLKNGSSSFYMIDLDPDSPNYLTNIGSRTLSQAITNHDWAFNAADGMLYTVEKHSNVLFRIDSSTGNVTALGEIPILSGLDYTYGAVYFDVDGNFYISANQTGTVYIVYGVQNITPGGSMTSNLFAYGPSSSSNDGARCPTAPVPQEDCTNGRDDDGDGLVDCDDPSCSGVAACPTLRSTSSGNDGGLESNNRLSQQISKRNINRIRTNHKFDKALAKRVPTDRMFQQKSFGNITLWDFIPVDILNAEVIESTPEDLKDITNAVDVVSVDYLQNGDNRGTLLALKTEGKVYEHTKHICDRFSGAEILSVSDVEINDAFFIKSVVKHPDGALEFVLSFSVRPTDDDSSFIVESHWNLDKYSEGTFYNFQIWASSIDDLYSIGKEVLGLAAVQKEITEYKNSEAPAIYVKKASYNDGKMNLTIVNSSKPTSVFLEGYMRPTETSESEKITYDIDIPNYLNEVTVETGKLYDFGFRINNSINTTPDDLFISDGTWGVDYSSEPYVNNFEVTQNDISSTEDMYAVERNISFSTDNNQDVSIYRSLTPKFEKVDLSDYSSFAFNAKGTGQLKVTLVKESISSWENQPTATITLSETGKAYTISKDDFTNGSSTEIELNDVKMLFFTALTSADKSSTNNKIEIDGVSFMKGATAGVEDETQNESVVTIVPNPIQRKATFNFESKFTQEVDFEVYDLLSNTVYSQKINANQGKNTINFDRGTLSSGIYFYRIGNKEDEFKGKFIIR